MAIVKISAVLLVVVAAASNGVSEATHTQQTHGLSELEEVNFPTYAKLDEYAPTMLARVNKERIAHGLPAMCNNKKLQAAAQRHCNDISKGDYLGDTDRDGATLEQRVNDAGFAWDIVSESMNADYPYVDGIMNWWLSEYNYNIMGNYTMLGSAYAFNNNTYYKHFWVQTYATSSTEHCDDEGISESDSLDLVAKEQDSVNGASNNQKPGTVASNGATEPAAKASKDCE